METVTAALNWSPDVESLLLDLESKAKNLSKFHIDIKTINACENKTEIDILNKFKLGILKTAKDNNVLSNLLLFFHDVLIVENWAGKTQKDANDSIDDDNSSSDHGVEDNERLHQDNDSDTLSTRLDETEILAIRDSSWDNTASFDYTNSAGLEKESEKGYNIYRTTVEKEHLKDLNKEDKNGNVGDPLTGNRIEEYILSADEHTMCKLPFAALAKMRPDILRICFQSGVDMNVFFEPECRNLLIYAVSLPSLESSTLELLLGGINIQTRTLQKRTALTESLVNDKTDSDQKLTMVRRLLDAGITLGHSGRFFSSPLHTYICAMISSDYGSLDNNWKDIIDELVNAGNSVNATNFHGRTPLMDAIEIIGPGDYELSEVIQMNERIIIIAEYLLQKGADPDMKDFDGNSSIFFALLRQNLKFLKMLLKYCRNTSIQNSMGMTAIYGVCALIEGPYDDGDIETIIVPMLDALATAGCDLNLQAIDMTTALHHSAVKQPHQICRKLCALGADTNKRDYLKRTPLHLAARNEDAEVINVLLKYGADLNARDFNNETPLHHACIFGNTDTATMLVRAGANVEAQSVLGIRPVHLAAENGDRDIIEYMMSIADHSARDIYGAQVLHYAAADGNTETVEYLLHIGVDEKQRDMNGMSALDLAKYLGHLETAQRLHGSESVQFGNLPVGCFPNGPLLDATQVDGYYKSLSDTLANERTNQKQMATVTARGLLTSKGLGSVKFEKEDGKLISDLIMTYANALGRRIGELDPLFQCEILRAGSTVEGVKTGYPDEFDFLCDLTALRQYVEHFEQGETEGFARVLLKKNVPNFVKRFCSGTTRYVSSTRILRHFSKLALEAKFEVLNELDLRGNIYAGASLLPEMFPMYNSTFAYLPRLNSQTLSFRGSQHKHLYIDIDFNPVIFSTKYPNEARNQCLLLPNVSSRGIYVIPKLCNVLGYIQEQNIPPLPPQEEHWRFSTQHIEAEVMQRMPQIALDGYMVCKIFRMEPLACSVKYLEQDGACLSGEQLKKLLTHGTVHDEDKSEADFESGDYAQAEEDVNESDNANSTARGTKMNDFLPDNDVDNEIGNTEVKRNESNIEFERAECDITKYIEPISNVNTQYNDATISYQTITDECENELSGENVVELTAEKAIPSYYIKSIFIKEMERMALDGEELSEESILKIPRRVYEQLLTALKESYLTTLFMPNHNMLKKRNDEESKVTEMREKYCKNILRLMDYLGFQ